MFVGLAAEGLSTAGSWVEPLRAEDLRTLHSVAVLFGDGNRQHVRLGKSPRRFCVAAQEHEQTTAVHRDLSRVYHMLTGLDLGGFRASELTCNQSAILFLCFWPRPGRGRDMAL